jgi:PAS domain S-box-containing protein
MHRGEGRIDGAAELNGVHTGFVQTLAQVAVRTASPVVITDASGRIEWVNDAFVRVYGYTPAEVLGHLPGEVLHGPASDPTAVATIDEARRRGEPFTVEIENYTRSGEPIWVEVAAEPLRNDAGVITHYMAVEHDITARKREELERARRLEAEQAARAEAERGERRATDILETITDGFCALDRTWRFTYVNGAAERLLRRPRADLIGQHVWDAFPQAAGTIVEEQLQRALDTGKPVSFDAYVERLGAWLEAKIFPSPDSLSVYFRDVTDHRQAEAARREGEARYREIAEATNDAVWDWDLRTQAVWRSDGMWALFGYQPTMPRPTDASWSDLVLPEDRERVANGVRAVIEGTGCRWSDEYRFRRQDGTYAEVLDRGLVIRDADGTALRMVGGMVDITERKRAEAALRENERRLKHESGRLLALHRASALLAGQATDPDAAVDEILRSASGLLGATSATLHRWDAQAGVLRCIRRHNVPDADTTPDLPPGEGLVGQIFARGEPMIVNERLTWRGGVESRRVGGLLAGIGVPLRHAGQPIGVLLVRSYHAETPPFTPEDAHLVALFADQAAAAVARADVATQREVRLARLRALTRVNQVISSSLNMDEVHSEIAASAAALTGATLATVSSACRSSMRAASLVSSRSTVLARSTSSLTTRICSTAFWPRPPSRSATLTSISASCGPTPTWRTRSTRRGG